MFSANYYKINVMLLKYAEQQQNKKRIWKERKMTKCECKFHRFLSLA
jgi:hypothetical protein